jgi:hypothetical protein
MPLPQVPELRTPEDVFCANCCKPTHTQVVYQAGTGAWIIGFVMCVAMLWPCCLMPLCVKVLVD